MNLPDLVKAIKDKDGLINFISELRLDLKDNFSTWENPTMKDYLEAMQSWLEDIDGWEKNYDVDVLKMPVWQFIGHILLASKMYE